MNIAGNAGHNRLTGNSAANALFGLDGNDFLIGGGGADLLRGGAGNDAYLIDALDRVIELAGQGYDTVQTAIGGVLPFAVERMVLAGMAAVNAVGNDAANMLVGNAAANILNGGAGNDALQGGGGADRFVFGAGVDTVIDFQNDIDTIVFRPHLGAATVDAAMTCAGQVGADVLFDFGIHDLLVRNARLADLRDDILIG